ncbi:MAG: DNA recombination protein RmuC [Marmoricola sp.]
MEILIAVLTLIVGLLAGVLAGLWWARRGDPESSIPGERAVVHEGLDRLADQLRDLGRERASWQGQLSQQFSDMRLVAEGLSEQTRSLSTALRRPEVRGRWGELHLRRTVEAAGLVGHCDFREQVHLSGPDGSRRPDLVVHLPGDAQVVVDAKTPLDAYLDALAAPADEQPDLLRRHARQVRAHVDGLSAKAYWRALPQAPEFVVLFVPSESCLAAALGADPDLIEYAADRDVVLAGPTTLIGLLRTVAHGWTAERLSESTREIHELGRELYDRLGTMGGHLDRLGRSLGSAVEAYNRTIGSLEGRVLVTARQFQDAGVATTPLESPRPVESGVRPLTAAETLAAVAEPRPELEHHDPPDRPRSTRERGA